MYPSSRSSPWHKFERSWYRLDNAGKIYPPLIGRRTTGLFRISATLDHPINLPQLSQALREVMLRFPYHKVSLRPGFFWYYLEENPRDPVVEGDSLYPCVDMPIKKWGMFPFRVRAYKGRVALELSHILADATGGLIFLKTLLARYLQIRGVEIPLDRDFGLLSLEEAPDLEEAKDGFLAYYDQNIPAPDRSPRAFHLKGKFLPRGQYHVLTGVLRLEEVKVLAKEQGVSVGELLTAQLLYTFQEYIQEGKEKMEIKAPVRINVPVNLRTIFPSQSMRNFFLSVEPWIDPRLGLYTFEEVCQKVHHYMRYEVDRKFLNQQITRNVRGELNPISRLLPLPIKNLVLPIAYKFLGESRYSSGMSNLGVIRVPPEMEAHIQSFDFYPPPSSGNRIKCTSLSYKGEVRISFGSLIESTELEKLFFRGLRKKGLHIWIESNRFY